MQVIHGTRYIDEVVQLFLQDAGRVYVHQDANYNVTTLTDLTGRVLERYFYSPYGQLEAVISNHPFDYDDDGDVDADDASMIDADCSGDYSGDCRRLDADGDREIDADDLDIIAAYIGGLSGDTALPRVPSSPRSRLGNPFAHQGLPLDAEIASYQNRARQYNPGLKRFMQKDRLDWGDGPNPYAYLRANPLSHRDPQGLSSEPIVDAPCCQGASYAPYVSAGTACCQERCFCIKVICFRPDRPPGESDCARHCLQKHEEVHLSQIECGGWPFCLTLPPPSTPPGSNALECPAYKAQEECIENCPLAMTPATAEEKKFVRCMKCATCEEDNPRYGKPYAEQLSHCTAISKLGDAFDPCAPKPQ